MELFYPVSQPINQTNLFGTPNAMYTSLGQKGHPGLDFEAPSGTALHSPVEGDAIYVTDAQGGDGLWIRVPNNVNPQYNVILWHLWPKGDVQFPFHVKTDGTTTHVKVGDLLGFTDNSGAPLETTGPHLHVGVMPCKPDGSALNPGNGFLGCVDPQPFFNGQYAVALPVLQAAIATETAVLNSPDLTPAQKVEDSGWFTQFIKWLFS